VKIRALLPATGKPPFEWVLEGVLIVVSVVLGMWVTHLQQDRGDRELAARVLRSIVAEVEHNLAALEPYVSVHGRWLQALGNAKTGEKAKSGFDVFFEARPELPPGARSPFPFLRRSAWDAAVAGGTLRLIDHDVVAVLSDLYRVQEIATGNVDRLANGVLTSPAIFDPGTRDTGIRLLALTLGDIESAERTLLDLYRRHLSTIRPAAH
jgi:hypothetical protein